MSGDAAGAGRRRLLEPDRGQRRRELPGAGEHVHCRNCPAFARAARGFFDRGRPPRDTSTEWAELLGRPGPAASGDDAGAPGLPARAASGWPWRSRRWPRSPSPRPVHRVPHRTNRVFSGLVSLRGQLQLCVSMHGLLDVDPPDPERRARRRTPGWS